MLSDPVSSYLLKNQASKQASNQGNKQKPLREPVTHRTIKIEKHTMVEKMSKNAHQKERKLLVFHICLKS